MTRSRRTRQELLRLGAGRRPGRARRGPRPGRCRRAGQPGRDGAGLGPGHRRAADSGDQLAGPPVGRRCAPGWPGTPDGWRSITGLPLDPYFAAPKMTWLRENCTRDGVVTTTDSWLLARLGPAMSPMPPPRPARCCWTWTRRTGRPRPARCSVSTRRAARRGGLRGRGRGDDGIRRAAAGRRARGGPAGRAARRALLHGRRGEVHVRHRRVPAGDDRGARPSGPRPGCRRRWPGGCRAGPRTASTGRSTPRAPRSAG